MSGLTRISGGTFDSRAFCGHIASFVYFISQHEHIPPSGHLNEPTRRRLARRSSCRLAQASAT
jgi:hypothetical protein